MNADERARRNELDGAFGRGVVVGALSLWLGQALWNGLGWLTGWW